MKNKIHVTEGLGGTGKTFELKNKMISEAKDRKKSIYLCYNRNLMTIAESTLPKNKNIAVMTFHAYVFKLLYENNSLPKQFIKNIDERPNNKDFDTLLKTIQKKLSEGSLKINETFTNIFIDEYQDFTFTMLKILKLIQKSMNSNLFFYGDPFQRLYVSGKINNKILSPKEMIEYIFQGYDIEYRTLKISHRSNNNILSLLNNFIEYHFKSDLKYKMDNSKKKQNDSIPTINFFNHQKDEMNFITEKIQKSRKHSKSIIIANYKRDLLIYNENVILQDLVKENRLIISTINGLKGDEADSVFWVGFQNIQTNNPNLKNQKELYYTALSRAKSKLTISTSYPKNHLDQFWTSSLRINTSRQKKNNKSQFKKTNLNKLNKLDQKKGYISKKKYLKSTIDTIVFKIDATEVPYIPYIPKDYTSGKGRFVKRLKGNIYSFNYSVRYHGSAQFFFDLYNLTPLKRIGMTDKEIVEFCFNIINNFFDGRIQKKSIKLHRIDIAQFVDKEQITDLNSLSMDVHNFLIANKSNSFIGYLSKKNNFDYIKNNRKWHINTEYTLYHNKQSTHYDVLIFYHPANKDNENYIPDKNLVKFESRKTFPGKKVKYTLKDLLDKIEDGSYLSDMTYLLPDILEIIEKHSNNTNTTNLKLFETHYKDTTISNNISIRDPYLKKVDL